ncbi:hypothetical protein ETAA8_28660 [Anatilimnocola aggregata]|uniref:DUF1802 family protein n=1 Tax=Anatilimnocola aggregata TaxID=2528021 RepID=A0A517YC09_9BACT|nr:DUF1802 family protein [Anatilimnocola aggregata]QDU27775.1 hypothetical protein ETAA8_28660 [Anatilimnocola aggregata]
MTENSCDVALKEWAVICRALETGQQTILLRKGGIAEGAGVFRPDHARFWLYPTQFHQTAEQVTSDLVPLLSETAELRTAAGDLVLRSVAVVEEVRYLTSIEQALALCGLHGWSEDVVRQRFAYRQPGLFLFVLRVFRSEITNQVTESAEMAGCKSWVALPISFPIGRSTPALTSAAFDYAKQLIHSKLNS